jgi:hypothetical protein
MTIYSIKRVNWLHYYHLKLVIVQYKNPNKIFILLITIYKHQDNET